MRRRFPSRSVLRLGATALFQLALSAQTFSFTTIDKLGADWTELNGINRYTAGIHSRSTIVGTYHDVNGRHAFSFSGGVFTTIPNPSGWKNTEGVGINNHGIIVNTNILGPTAR